MTHRTAFLMSIISAAAMFVTLAPAGAQQQPADARIKSESEPKISGALPAPSLQLGRKGEILPERDQAASAEVKPLTLSSEPLALPLK